MNPALDGWFVLKQQAATVVWVIGFMLLGAVLGTGLLRRHGLQQFGFDEIVSLASGIWMPVALLVAALTLILSAVLPAPRDLQAALALPAVAALLWVWLPPVSGSSARHPSWPAAILLLLVSASLLVVRLGFVRGLVLPLYFDSAAHFGLIQQLLRNAGSADWSIPLTVPVPGYYHLGYHVLLAGLVRLTGLEIASSMLVSGQVLLAGLSIPLYHLALRSTGSRMAGFLAVTFGTLGWYMPAHAANWGKYPALFGLPAVLGTIILACEASRSRTPSTARWVWLVGAVVCALTAVLFQTRLGIVVIIVSAAWVLSGSWNALAPRRRIYSAGVLLLGASTIIGLINRNPIQRLLLEPFAGSGILATALVGFLLPWAYRHYPRITFALVLIVTLLLAGLVVPGPAGGLLDRPLVQMLLPLPLSLLGAAGAPGFGQFVARSSRLRGNAAGMLLSAAVVANALFMQGFGPSVCCGLVSTNDLVALDWLRREVPAASRVAVAVAPMQVNPGSTASLQAGTDAGIWIPSLTGLSIVPLSSTTDFASVATHGTLCQQGIDVVYAGGGLGSFDVAPLIAEPLWYPPVLKLPGVSVFSVRSCEAG